MIGLGLGVARATSAPESSASLEWALGGGNWVKSNGNKTATNTVTENAYQYSQAVGATGKWVARVEIDTASNAASDRYLTLAGEAGPSGPPNPGYVFTGEGAGVWAVGMTGGGGLPTFSAGDALDFILDIGAGKCWLRKNGVLTQGDPVAGTSPSITFTPGQTVYLAVGRNNNGSGSITATLASSIPNVPVGYTTK